jgi:hypothetical protein
VVEELLQLLDAEEPEKQDIVEDTKSDVEELHANSGNTMKGLEGN